MIKRIPRVAGALTGLVLAVGVMAGCSSDDSDTSSETTGAATESSAMMSESAMADPAADAAAAMFGREDLRRLWS